MMCIKCGEVGCVSMYLCSDQFEDRTCSCSECGEDFWAKEIEEWLRNTEKATKAWRLYLEWKPSDELIDAIHDVEHPDEATDADTEAAA